MMIGTTWHDQHRAISARLAPCTAAAGRIAAELADRFEPLGVDAAPLWDERRGRWGVRVVEPANGLLHMHVWLDDDHWTWVPGCAWSAAADDHDRVVRFVLTWVTEHRVVV
ncbi:hypothetical protein [Actinopolymorpha cephalotaxi]|uniref:DUF3024 domain-containing protein n=2 Tax=Actinopolymorpha cephalotaxi TaxID=504797 RepID=A0ABX2S3N6_9ACTN|nr:hypothetical protein [Actinopolymorpha cephalotaxi]NYH83899.1 hypothetical protein [Actinopolymorpha cephalotaxi]